MLLYLFILNFVESVDFVNGILGGSEIEIEEAPYHVNYGDVCGGVLIHRKWVLTTAHCGYEHVYSSKEDFIRIGDKYRLGGPEVKIRRHIVHRRFAVDHEFDYDIQLLELSRKLKVTERVTPVKIGEDVNADYIFVAGWGYAKEKGDYLNKLQQVRLKLVSFSECQKVQQKWYNDTLTSRMFCAGGDKEHDACQGDSGGAAVSNGLLLGIASFGFGCGRDIPGVYINVSNSDIRDFINKYTGI